VRLSIAGREFESSNPKVAGWDGAAGTFVEYLYELAGSR